MDILAEKSSKSYLGWEVEFFYVCEISQYPPYIWIWWLWPKVYSLFTYRLVWRFICLVKLFNSSTEIEFAKRLNGRVSRPFEFEFDLLWYQFRKFPENCRFFYQKIAKKHHFEHFLQFRQKYVGGIRREVHLSFWLYLILLPFYSFLFIRSLSSI